MNLHIYIIQKNFLIVKSNPKKLLIDFYEKKYYNIKKKRKKE